MAKLIEVIREYLEVQRLEKEIQERKNKLRNQLFEFLGDNASLQIDNYKVNIVKQSRYSIDTKNLKLTYPDIAKEFEKKIEFKTIRIKEVAQ